MSSNYTTTTTISDTFTITHAKHIASKVATDLLRFQRFYGIAKQPLDQHVRGGVDYIPQVRRR